MVAIRRRIVTLRPDGTVGRVVKVVPGTSDGRDVERALHYADKIGRAEAVAVEWQSRWHSPEKWVRHTTVMTAADAVAHRERATAELLAGIAARAARESERKAAPRGRAS